MTMIEPGWTPGPWATLAPRDGIITCKPSPYGNVISFVAGGLPEATPNARLIAAAPELYAALDRILIVAYSEAYGTDDDRIAKAAARAALAKARGETP